MALQLNAPSEGQTYREFYGKTIEQMPELITEGRTPLSAQCLMKRRVDVVKGDNVELRDSWMYNYFDTGDAIAYHPNGKIKVVLDAQPLRELNAKSKLSNGALVLEDGTYEALKGVEFTRRELETGRSLSKKEVLAHPVWRVLARDEATLEQYTDTIFKLAKDAHGYDENMGIYVSDKPKSPQMRLWCVVRLNDDGGGGSGGGDAGGDDNLGDGGGRLVGVAPEALSAKKIEPKPTVSESERRLEDRVLGALNAGKAFEYNGILYAPMSRDSGIKLE